MIACAKTDTDVMSVYANTTKSSENNDISCDSRILHTMVSVYQMHVSDAHRLHFANESRHCKCAIMSSPMFYGDRSNSEVIYSSF